MMVIMTMIIMTMIIMMIMTIKIIITIMIIIMMIIPVHDKNKRTFILIPSLSFEPDTNDDTGTVLEGASIDNGSLSNDDDDDRDICDFITNTSLALSFLTSDWDSLMTVNSLRCSSSILS